MHWDWMTAREIAIEQRDRVVPHDALTNLQGHNYIFKRYIYVNMCTYV